MGYFFYGLAQFLYTVWIGRKTIPFNKYFSLFFFCIFFGPIATYVIYREFKYFNGSSAK